MPEADEALCQGVSSLTTSNEHEYDKVLDKKNDVVKTYVLQHVKHDFYKKGQDVLNVVVYVKEINMDSLQVNFEAKVFHLTFQTRYKEFLKLYDRTSEDTVFSWHVNLRHKVDYNNCKYEVSPTKLTITLKKACVKDQWNCLEELRRKGENGDKLVMNGGRPFSKSTERQVAERDIANIEINQNGKENFSHCNGKDAKFSSKIQTGGTENYIRTCKFGLDGNGVPGSLSDDENSSKENMTNETCESFRKNKIFNEKNKNCECHEKSNNSEGVLSNETKSPGNRVSEKCTCESTTKKGNVECSRQTHNTDNKYTSDLTSTRENNCQKTDPTCQSSDEKESSSLKISNTNNVQDLDEPCAKDKVADESFKLNYDAKKHKCRPGSAGLINPANLCYINSVVQCLSSVRELRTYLLSKKHYKHINYDNKNGYQGELIRAFEAIIQELWSGKERYVSASKLKYELGKKHKQFMHYGQGDAQECLTFLLDGLHEDLKNDEKKSLGEIQNCDAKDILKGSRKHWEKFINGNHSIISDLFHGQSVFEMHCKECAKPSIGFDHWMQLNLPIPDDPKYWSVYVFFLDTEKKPLQTKLKVCQGTRCVDLLIQLSNIVGVPNHCFILLRSVGSRISHIFDPIEQVSLPSSNDILIACEIVVPKQAATAHKTQQGSGKPCTCAVEENLDFQANHNVLHVSVIQRLTHRRTGKCSYCDVETSRSLFCSKCCKTAYCNGECQSKDWKRHRQYCMFQPLIIGVPFIISVDSSKATLSELKSRAYHYARYSVAPKNGDLVSNKFRLTLLENVTDIHSKGTKLTDSGDDPVISENVCLTLDWESTTPDSKVISKDLDCNVHETVNQNRSRKDNSCSLEECLQFYWNPENINKNCGWRCDHCKDIRAATRKVMICKHPENLVIHFKRFSYSGNGRKIGKHIQFPLRGLDMSTFTHPEIPTDGAVYDLRAVCSHHGYMNFGHYIAFCKPYSEEELNTMALTNTDGWLRYDDSRVNSVNESDTERTEAYILFYQRRKKETVHSEPSSVKSDDTSKTDVCDPDVEEILAATHMEQGTTVKNIDSEITNVIVVEQESTFHRLSESMTTRNEVLLEDQLD